MTFTAVLLIYRKPGLPMDAFKKHYETVHVPLMKSLVGDLFPLSHTRRYISREEDSSSTDGPQPAYKTTMISGDASEVPYDAIAEMEFETQADFFKLSAALATPENQAKVGEDCAQFMDLSKAPAVFSWAEVCVSRRG